jgi:hypothetical protein
MKPTRNLIKKRKRERKLSGLLLSTTKSHLDSRTPMTVDLLVNMRLKSEQSKTSSSSPRLSLMLK